MPDRFVVTAVRGWTIRPGDSSLGSKRAAGTSYSVIDTVACCREVGRFYAGQGGRGQNDYHRRRLAEELCADLNAQEAEYEALHA